MNSFVRGFADYLRPYVAEFCPVILTPPGELSDAPRIGLLEQESASELVSGNRTMDLSLKFSALFRLAEEGVFDSTAIDAAEMGLYTALSTALDNLVQYMPLPGQPDTAPLLLAATLTPPQAVAENYTHLIQFDISLTVQF